MVGADSSPRVAGEGKWRRRDFPAFPFEPYSIQIEFMMALYDSLESGGVALLESPTGPLHSTPSILLYLFCHRDCVHFLGTGKTLSIICSAFQWLLDQREKPKKASTRSTGDEEEPDWMRDFVMDVPEKKYVVKKRDGFRFGGMSNCKRDLMDRDGKIRGEGEDDEFLMEEYDSDIDERLKRKSESLSSSDDEDEGGEEQAVEVVPKIYFCSRTHSQLSQFIKEFKRTSFVNEISLVCLGSRKNLCINPGLVYYCSFCV